MVDLFSQAIKKDKRLIKLKKMISAGAFAIDTERHILELKTMLTTRKIRRLQYKDVVSHQQKYIIEAALQNQASRSRSVEIKTECNKITMTLSNTLRDLSNYLKVKYKHLMITSGYKNVSSQKEAINTSFIFIQRHIDRINIVEKICDMLIEDIDKSGFLIKALIDVLSINVRGKFDV